MKTLHCLFLLQWCRNDQLYGWHHPENVCSIAAISQVVGEEGLLPRPCGAHHPIRIENKYSQIIRGVTVHSK